MRVVIGLMVLIGTLTTAQAEDGVTSDKILLGQSCALQGPAAALGKAMQTGLEVAFAQANGAGGVNGRKIELKTINDGYEPKKCELVTKTLIEKSKVFAMIGGVGTPTAVVAVPICEANATPFIGPFTGAEFLRSPFKKWVVNLRGSYYQEMERLAEHLVDQRGFKKIACFYQNDGYGQAGLSGIEIALKKRGMELCAKGTYERNTVAVAPGLKAIEGSSPDAIIMVGAYKPCAAFIKAGKANPATQNAVYCNISFVGTMALLKELGGAADGCVVSQVVPFPWDSTIPVVKEFHDQMNAQGKSDEIGFGTLEGFLVGKLFCETMKSVSGEPTRESFIAALQARGKYDFGGVVLQFGADDHQGMDEVFLTVFKNGKVQPLVDEE